MIDQQRRTLVTALSLIGTAALAGTPVWAADTFPSKPATVIVPYPPGGAADVVTRLLTESMSKYINQRIVVENAPGATGMIGANRVLRAPANGYTFFAGTTQEVIVVPMLNPSATYQSTDFQLIAPTYETNLVLLAKSDIPATSLDEFVDYARKSKESLSYATVGIDSMYHLMGEAMAKRIGVEFLHVPYAGGSPALQGLGGGQVDFAILAYQANMEALVEQGRFKFITSFSNRLPPPLKHLPTIGQSTVLGDFTYSIPGGYYTHANTPEAPLKVLRDAIAKTLADQTIRDRMEIEGRLIPDPMQDREQVAAYFAELIDSHRKLLTSIDRQPRF
ncbi:tripartite tricarboxylate transporter substrate binding protein [Alcaligenaceae bacterium]|nr:tripartite tricarboxylate transporter substrate binding protein [Alcaligenaceae bacterium]